MEELIGRYAYKKSGYFSGLIGVIKKSDGLTPYVLATKTGLRITFTKKNQIELVNDGGYKYWKTIH